MGCPCHHKQRSILVLRGLCSIYYTKSLLDRLYTPVQLPGDPTNALLVGRTHTRIEYNDTTSQWTMTDAKSSVSAVSEATKVSYVLGKHTWTVFQDKSPCNPNQEEEYEEDYEGKWTKYTSNLGRPYPTQLKLTGCGQEGEFTCDDGQCVRMEERCDQVAQCRDKSDEENCELIVWGENYKKSVPPFTTYPNNFTIKPLPVNVSITLKKVVAITETKHKIDFSFIITLEWNDTRVRYHNLKNESIRNKLSLEEVEELWLPYIIYKNTDDTETTKLGDDWTTDVMVNRTYENTFPRGEGWEEWNRKRDGKDDFIRSSLEEVDETEIFHGATNTLIMNQTYTRSFQCEYDLHHYPFDTQVIRPRLKNLPLPRFAQ